MRLYRRGAEFSIRVGPHELMNSRVHASEEALAELACKALAGHERTRILVGGLGMGFTLAAVLSHAGASTRVDVAELVAAVIGWNRTELKELNGAALADSRVTVREGDVATLIGAEKGAYDAILLDVDNGPSALTSKANHRLYGTRGLDAAYAALRPGGVLAVWSADHDPAFTKRLRQAGFQVEEHPVRARGRAGGSRFLVWIARRA